MKPSLFLYLAQQSNNNIRCSNLIASLHTIITIHIDVDVASSFKGRVGNGIRSITNDSLVDGTVIVVP